MQVDLENLDCWVRYKPGTKAQGLISTKIGGRYYFVVLGTATTLSPDWFSNIISNRGMTVIKTYALPYATRYYGAAYRDAAPPVSYSPKDFRKLGWIQQDGPPSARNAFAAYKFITENYKLLAT